MIPYWNPGSIEVIPGVLMFHTFGLLVGIAVLVGGFIAQRRAEQAGLSGRVMADAAIFFVIVGFLFAHWVSVVFYFPDRLWGAACETHAQCMSAPFHGVWGKPADMICQDNGRCNNGHWSTMLMIWNGISSVGGFLGAFVGILIFFRVSRIPLIPGVLVLEGGKNRPALKYVDAAAYGMAFAWIFGRAACFTAHDHIGRLTNSPFGIRFPRAEWPKLVTPEALEMFGDVSYVQRFDLGFLEMLYAIVMSIVFFFVARNEHRLNLRPGWYAAVLIFFYAPYRLFLDSLRARDIDGADPRYWLDMTAAQWGTVIMMVLAIWIWWLGGRARNKPGYMDNSAFPLELGGEPAAAAAAASTGAATDAATDAKATGARKSSGSKSGGGNRGKRS